MAKRTSWEKIEKGIWPILIRTPSKALIVPKSTGIPEATATGGRSCALAEYTIAAISATKASVIIEQTSRIDNHGELGGSLAAFR